jgi:hypothetical protein
VELPTTILTYDVEPAVGPMISGQPIAWDPETGYFQFPFNPVDAGVSGQLRFILKAFDGKDSSTVFILTDDPVAPRLTSGTVAANNDSVNLQFSEGIYHAGATDPLSSDLSLVFAKGSGTAEGAVATGLIGTPAGGTASLNLGILVTGQPSGAETITIAGTLTDRVGNPLAPLYDSVTLNLKDKTAPEVVQVSSTLAAGSAHKAGEVVPVTVLFSEPVTVSSALALALNVGASAACSAGTGSSLTLNYTVQAGHNVDPLNYTDAAALTGAAVDLEGNPALMTLPDPASAEALAARNLRIDTIAPAEPALQILDGGDELINKAENEDPAGVPFTLTGEEGATYDLSLTNCTLFAGTDPGTLPAAGFALKASGTGIFTVTVSATLTDLAGNVGSSGSDTSQANLTVPNPPSVSTPGTNPTNTLTPTWQWVSGGGGGSGYRYHLDLEDWAETDGTSYKPATDLNAGSHTLYVQERNAVGNWSASGSLAILIDVTPPNSPAVSLNDGGDGWINIAENGAGVPFSVTGESGATYTIALDNATLISGSASGILPAAGFVLQAAAGGTVTITVTLTDPAGNSSVFPGTASSDADLQAPGAPTVTVTEDPPDNKKPTWNWTPGGGGNGTYRRKLDSGTEVQTTASEYTPSTNLPAGTHILHVRERDAAGNWSEYGDSPAVTTS